MKPLLTLLFLCLLTPAAYAACPPAPTADNNLIMCFQPSGDVRTGTLPKSSAASGEDVTEGALLYDPAIKTFKFCNGTDWLTLGAINTAGIAKAWVAFNGTNGNILSGYNVSSVTRQATGRWIVNFTNPMPNTSFSTVATCMNTGAGEGSWTAIDGYGVAAKTLSSVRIINWYSGGSALIDCPEVYVTVFAN